MPNAPKRVSKEFSQDREREKEISITITIEILTVLRFNGVCGGRSAASVVSVDQPDCHPACGMDTCPPPSSDSSCPTASPGRCDRHNLSFLSARIEGEVGGWGSVCLVS